MDFTGNFFTLGVGSLALLVSLLAYFLGVRRGNRARTDFDGSQAISLLKATLESTNDGILVVDREGRMVSFNQKFLQMWGIPESIGESRNDEAAISYVLSQLKSPEGFLGRVHELYSQPDVESYDPLEFKDGRVFERFSKPQRVEGRIVGRVWSFRDISELRRTTTSRQYFEKILNTIADPIFVKDRQHRWVLLNDSFCQFIGRGREEMLGKSDYDFFSKEESDVFWTKDEEVFTSGEENLNEEALTDTKGVTHYILTRKAIYTDEEGARFIVGTIRDITARRNAERALRAARDELEQRVHERTAELSWINDELKKEIQERLRAEDELKLSERKYRNLVETSHDLIWSVDMEGRWTFLNREGARRIYGYEPEEMLGRRFMEFESPDQAAKDLDTFAQVKAGQTFAHYETEHVRKNGAPVYLSFNALPSRDEQGQVLGATGTASDITGRRQAEEKLRESEERVRTIIDRAMDAVVVIDSNGKITYWNPQAERVFGWNALEAMGRNAGELIMPPIAYTKMMQRFLEPSFESTAFRRLETRARRSDGHEFSVEISVSPLHWAGESVFSAFIRDITDRKLAEEAIRQKTEELARSNKELQDFAYVASHDMQEPLHKIIAFGDRLRANAVGINEKGMDSLDRIQRAALRMRQLINDLLQYARVTTRAKPYETVDLSAILREVLSVLELRIAETKAKVCVGELAVVEADRSQMLQLFQNLLSNAFKFSKPGKVPEVEIYAEACSERMVEITVKDHGIGFEQRFSDVIFKPFQRLHGRNQYEGTGMGLAICQKIVVRHGGTIEAESEPGVATVFRIRLPLHPT